MLLLLQVSTVPIVLLLFFYTNHTYVNHGRRRETEIVGDIKVKRRGRACFKGMNEAKKAI